MLRAKAHNVAHWGLDLITAQLFDPESKIVPIVALSVLDEASDDKLNLEAMVCSLQNKDLDHLGKCFFKYLIKVHTVTKYLVRLGGDRSWPQGFVVKNRVNNYNVGRELFKVWTANSDMKQDSKESSPRSLDSMLLKLQINSQNVQSTH